MSLAADIVEEIISLFPNFHQSPKYLEAFRVCSDPTWFLYENLYQDPRGGSWGVPPEDFPDTLSEWRKALTENSQLDVVKVDIQYEKKTWAKGRITRVLGNNEFLIIFENESPDMTRTLMRDSHEIAPFNTKSFGDDWRKELKKGSLVDVCDTVGIWYHSTIQDTRVSVFQGVTSFDVQVGYRVYEPNGEKSDVYGNFRGWSAKFDEWISAWSPRITEYDSCARRTSVSQDKHNEEKIIDDSNDCLEVEPWAFFVTRAKKCESVLLIRILNRVKKGGVFDAFLEVMKKNEPWPSFDLIFSVVYFVGKAAAMFHRNFAREYIPEFNSLVMQKLIDSPQANYRDFNKEKLDIVIFNLESLLKRVYSIEAKNEKIEQFTLEISLKSFQTPYLERKIQGLRGISDAISRAKFAKESTIQTQELTQWIKDHDIICEVFGPKGHYQLVQRCGEIVTLLSNSGELTRKHLEFIWASAQKQDEDMRQSVYKMLGEVNCSIKPEHLEMIVEFIEQIPPNKILRDDILLVQEITKYAVRAEAAAKRACGFLWHSIIDNAGYSNTIIDLALETYIGLMKGWELEKNRMNVMIDCLKKIKENKSVTLAIQIIKNLINSFPLTTSQNNPINKSEAIGVLVNQHGFLDAFFENLVYFKNIALEFAENKQEDITNLIVIDRIKYKEEIEERLSLLQTLVSGTYDITLSRTQMDTLWETFLKKSLCSAEREHYLKWLADATESQSQGKKVFDDSDIYSFFIEKVANIEDNYKDMQLEGFGVFKSYFLLVNVSMKKMQQNVKQSYFMGSSFYQTESFPKEFEYQILVAPLELEGIKCLRKIMVEVDSDMVLGHALELFYELYDNVNYVYVDENEVQIRQEFIEFCLGFIEGGDLAVKKRAMVILRGFMEECEKRGTGGLQPHNSMLKGDLHMLTFVNHISFYPYPADMPKKIELKVYSNTTIWELRCMLGKQVKCLNDQFRILRSFSNKEIKDNENGKTLSDLRIRLNENFTMYRRNSKVPRVPLINENGGLNTAVEKIFSSWFYKHADKGDKMTQAGCAAFTSSCTGDTCQATDKSIQDLFNTYDDDRDGLLTLENFLSFYEKSCINKPITVWSNLNSHHYRGDLRKYDDGEEPVEVESLPGFIIMQKQENYDLLFTSLNIKELANDAWDLLVKLPTNPYVKSQIKDITADFDWSRFLDLSSFYKLLYNLQIIEFFMQEVQVDDYEEQKAWKIKFVTSQGFKTLLNILLSFQKTEGVFEKKCLAFVLNLVSVFVLAGFASMSPELYAAVELVRKQSVEEVINSSEGKEKEEKDKDFKILNDLRDEIIKFGLENELIATVDFTKLITKLMEIMAEILNSNENEVEDKHIIESALELWVSCLFHNNSLIESVYNFNSGMDIEEFTCTALTHGKFYHVRSLFCKSLANVCEKVVYEEKMPIPYFLTMLMKHVPKGKIVGDKEYSQFFEILCKLLELDMYQPSQDYEKLIDEVMKGIIEHPFVEKRTSYLSDRVLVGLLNMAEIIFRNNSEFKDQAYNSGFTQELFLHVLFPPKIDFSDKEYSLEYVQETSHMLPPKAKCRDSRVACYRLVSSLMNGHNQNLETIIDLINELKDEITSVKSWNYSPLSDSRQNYSGIYNLGCICYMNSMLQQFFFIPQFRYSILDADDKLPPNLGPNDIDDNLLHQLQKMYGFLELTERQAYNPTSFCYSFKDFSGMPTNISLQQDAQEFLNMIFDRIETSLKDTSYKHLIQGIFGGKTISQCICKVCGTVKENLEDFNNLSLDVKHSKTLAESLQRFISGDTISDYNCEKCNKRVDITKRNLIDSVPNVIIMHLQRIVFNFDTFANEKINTRLEFPSEVDLYPYTKSGTLNPDIICDDYKYELTGIVVHKGTAEVGHYYSFIKTEPNKWYEFNDSTVKTFNPTRIEAECFGGVSEDESNWMKSYKDNSRNAYMLVYEKKIKHDLKLQVLEGDSTTSPKTITKDFDCYNRTMPASVYQAVLADNDKYLLQKNIYNMDFFSFILDTINASLEAKVDISTTVLQLVFEVLCRSFHNKILPDILSALKKLFNMFPENFEKFIRSHLEDNLSNVLMLLLICTEKITRDAMADFFTFCLIKQSEVDFSENSDVKLFIMNLLAIVPQDLSKHWTRFQQFWQLFKDFALGGEAQAVFLLNSGVIAMFIDFYLAEKSPLMRPGEKRNPIGNKMWTPCFDPLIQTIAAVSPYCTNGSTIRAYDLTEADRKCLFDSSFYEKTLSNSYDSKSLGLIIQHWCKDDYLTSEKIGKILLKSLNDRDLTDIQGLFEVISMFLTIEDPYTTHRIEWMLGFPVISKLLLSDTTHPFFASASVTYIDEEIFTFPSTLELFTAWNSNDSILTLIWKYHKRWETYCLIYVKYVLRIFNLNSNLALYAKNLPPPTYQYSSLLNWFEDFIHKARANAYSSSKDDNADEALQNLLKLKEVYGLNEQISYVIGKTVDKRLYGENDANDILLKVVEYKTEWFISQPDGNGNKAIPNKILKADQVQGYTVEIPYKTINYPKANENDTGDETVLSNEENIISSEVSNIPSEFTQIKFEAFNKTSMTIRLKLMFNKGNGLNYYCPANCINAEIMPQSSKDIIVISKIVPEEDWGDINYRFEVCNRDFERINDDVYCDNGLQHYSDDVAVNVSDDDIRNPGGQISCPSCTSLNDSSAVKCEMCESSLVKSDP